VLKSVPAQPFLSVRATFAGIGEALETAREVARAVCARVAPHARGHLTVVAHSDFDDQDLDLEIGFGLSDDIAKPIYLSNGTRMTKGELAAADRLATLVRSGPPDQSHATFGALGIWMEANGYQVAGPCREVFLEVPFEQPVKENMVVEIQFPVSKAA
jgi:effector-binding domain-containing protein